MKKKKDELMQLDLFSYIQKIHSNFSRQDKDRLCLDCGKEIIKLTYNDMLQRYSGDRLCKLCQMSFKRRYLS